VDSIPTWQLISLVIAGFYFNTWIGLLTTFINILHHRVGFVVLMTLSLTLSLIFSTCFVYYLEKQGSYWFMGQIAGQSVITIASGIFLVLKMKSKFSWDYFPRAFKWKYIKNVFEFTFPLALATFFMWILNDSYRFILEKYTNMNYLGFLGVGMAVAASITQVIESLFHQIYYPIFYRDINTDSIELRSAAWNKMFKASLPVYISTCVFISFLSPFLMTFLSHAKYFEAHIYIVFGAWFQFSRMISGLLATVGHSEMNTRKIILPYVIGSILVVSGVFLSVKDSHYYYFVPASLVISGAASMGVMFLQMKKLMDIHLDKFFFVGSFLMSLPFALALLLKGYGQSFWHSFFIIGVFGAYYLFLQWYFYRHEKMITK